MMMARVPQHSPLNNPRLLAQLQETNKYPDDKSGIVLPTRTLAAQIGYIPHLFLRATINATIQNFFWLC